MRESLITERHHKQQEFIKDLLDKKTISPRTFHLRNLELEKWVVAEKESLKGAKLAFEQVWECT